MEEKKASRRDLVNLIHKQKRLIHVMEDKMALMQQVIDNYEEIARLKDKQRKCSATK